MCGIGISARMNPLWGSSMLIVWGAHRPRGALMGFIELWEAGKF